jgi:hypothetical protein
VPKYIIIHDFVKHWYYLIINYYSNFKKDFYQVVGYSKRV